MANVSPYAIFVKYKKKSKDDLLLSEKPETTVKVYNYSFRERFGVCTSFMW